MHPCECTVVITSRPLRYPSSSSSSSAHISLLASPRKIRLGRESISGSVWHWMLLFLGVVTITLGAASVTLDKNDWPYGNPWYYGGATRNHPNRSNRTEAQAEALWSETVRQPFNLDTYVKILSDYKHCRLMHSSKTNSSIINIPVGRTGSGTLKQSFLMNKLPGHHSTMCTALDAQKAGYSAVAVTIRDPVARILSGFQRRAESKGEESSKKENAAFSKEFTSKGQSVNYYLTALRETKHPKHKVALELTYGGGRQSYMMPISEYYGLTDKRLKIRVYFLCTPTLSEDFENIGKLLGWPKPSAARDYYLASVGEKRRLGSISGTKSEVAAQHVSAINARWIHEESYKADSELNRRFCGEHRKVINYHDGYSLI